MHEAKLLSHRHPAERMKEALERMDSALLFAIGGEEQQAREQFDEFRDGMDDLVANAVTLISCPSPGKLPLLDDLTKHFATRTRAVAVIPYDPALESGSTIVFSQIADATRRAWLDASAALVQGWGR